MEQYYYAYIVTEWEEQRSLLCSMNLYEKLKTEGEFNDYLVFESTTHEYWYKFLCYGSSTNCSLHKHNNQKL